ncbi:MAG: hypothetical protein AAB434_10115, partial [Planctomycetota bacterium]
VDGDDGDHDDDDDENADFVSYEDNDSLMIIEDNLYGLDVDSNYWKAQFNAGIALCLQHEKDLTISLTYAYVENVTDPDRLDLADGAEGFSQAEPLGHEVDVKFLWQYSDSLTFDLAWAGLFEGEFWSSNGSVDQDPSQEIGDNMYIISVGATVKF